MDFHRHEACTACGNVEFLGDMVGALCHPCAGIKQSEPPPVYTIRARDVVPGMRYGNCDPILDVRRTGGLVEMTIERIDDMGERYECLTGYGAETMVRVTLPGPSPRELSCAPPCHLHRAPLRAYATPGIHSPGCPVAPVDGLHGGMRLWPTPFRGHGWAWWNEVSALDDDHGYEANGFGVDPSHVTLLRDDLHAGYRDVILQCFYHPPRATYEPPARPPWDRRWTGDTPWGPEDL